MKKVQKRLARFRGDCGPSDTANGGRAPESAVRKTTLMGITAAPCPFWFFLIEPLPLPHELTREAYILSLTVDSQRSQALKGTSNKHNFVVNEIEMVHLYVQHRLFLATYVCPRRIVIHFNRYTKQCIRHMLLQTWKAASHSRV